MVASTRVRIRQSAADGAGSVRLAAGWWDILAGPGTVSDAGSRALGGLGRCNCRRPAQQSRGWLAGAQLK